MSFGTILFIIVVSFFIYVYIGTTLNEKDIKNNGKEIIAPVSPALPSLKWAEVGGGQVGLQIPTTVRKFSYPTGWGLSWKSIIEKKNYKQT